MCQASMAPITFIYLFIYLNIKKNVFIYLWLRWVFIASRRAFSFCEHGLTAETEPVMSCNFSEGKSHLGLLTFKKNK